MRAWPFLLLFLACGGDAREEPVAPVDRDPDDGAEAAEVPSEPVSDEPSSTAPTAAEANAPEDTSGEGESPAVDERHPTAGTTAPSGEPTVFTQVMFDLRGMPHRGPRDVDPEMIRMRTEHLMQQMREAAGDPEPRLTYQPGVSQFRAEFYGARSDALAQCRRAVRQVLPSQTSMRSGRAAFRDPRATPCAPIDPAP